MADAINSLFLLFQTWLNYVFNDFYFEFSGYRVSFGWLIVAVSMISIIIGSILNIPNRLPGYAFTTRLEHYKRDFKRYEWNRSIRYNYNKGKRVR